MPFMSDDLLKTPILSLALLLSELLMHARHCAKCFTDIISFSPQGKGNPVNKVHENNQYTIEETDPESLRKLAQRHTVQ